MKKQLTFYTFRKYCNKHVTSIESGHRHASKFSVYANNFVAWTDGGACTEDTCPVWKRFKNVKEN